ncbi:MAG: DUF4126 domain-containing protein [Desulfuromonadales bacterium]|nr:DUF4126 domain-containing protein [Desulfuromonadales bacterium]
MDPLQLDLLHAVLVGIGLSAACGFRVFVPLLGVSIAALAGYLPLSSEFAWLGTWPALLALAVATVLEVGAYSVPVIDHLMDVIAAPAAIVAGTLLMASLLGDASPLLKWSLAVIAGGGAAGIVQAGSMAFRGGSTLLTGGLGNLLVAALEFFGAIVMTVLALLLPLLAIVGLVVMVFVLIHMIIRRLLVNPTPPVDPPI